MQMAVQPRHGPMRTITDCIMGLFCLEKKARCWKSTARQIINLQSIVCLGRRDLTNDIKAQEPFPDVSSWESGHIRFSRLDLTLVRSTSLQVIFPENSVDRTC
jgi:hypothetical protein